MDNHPSVAWLAPCCAPLAEGASFCPALAKGLVPLSAVAGAGCSGWAGISLAGRRYGSVVGTFPFTNGSYRNSFAKLNLCRKVDLCERERGLGAFCPSHVCWESLWLGEEAGKASVIHLVLFSFPAAVQWSNKGRPWTR